MARPKNHLAVLDGPRLTVNKSGYWSLTWATQDAPGCPWRTNTVSCRTKDRGLAEDFKRAFLASEAQDKVVNPVVTVGRLVEGYRAEARMRGVFGAQQRMLNPVVEHLGHMTPLELTPEVISAYRLKRGRSDGTLRRELGALVAAFNWAIKNRKAKREEIPFVQLPPSPLGRQDWLDEAEEARLWALASSVTDRRGRLTRPGMFLCLALGTGARFSAIRELTWDRVDLTGRTIDFRDPKKRATKKVRVAAPINGRLLPVIERMWRERDPIDRYVIGEGNPRESVERFLKANGFTATPHVMRHTFISLGLRAGITMWDMAGLVGASVQVITDVYGHHASDSHLHRAANKRFAA
jgi:integrase